MYGAWCTLNLVQSLILCRGPLWSNRVYKRFIVRQLSHTRHSTNDETKSVPKHFSHERTIIDVATLSIIVYFDDSLSSTNFYRGGVAKSAEKETNGKKKKKKKRKKEMKKKTTKTTDDRKGGLDWSSRTSKSHLRPCPTDHVSHGVLTRMTRNFN